MKHEVLNPVYVPKLDTNQEADHVAVTCQTEKVLQEVDSNVGANQMEKNIILTKIRQDFTGFGIHHGLKVVQ